MPLIRGVRGDLDFPTSNRDGQFNITAETAVMRYTHLSFNPRRDTPRAHWCQLNVKPSQRLLFDY